VMEATQVSRNRTNSVSSSVIELRAGADGHFVSPGRINGQDVMFMVDTGATVVTLGQSTAEKLGLPWRQGPLTTAQTANGSVQAQLVGLDRLQLQGVELTQVQAVVLPASMDFILLGNTFLSRFNFQQTNQLLRLELKAGVDRMSR